MRSRLTELKPETACVCKSGKTWAKCCGALLESKEGTLGYVSNEPNTKCVRFIVSDGSSAAANDDGEILAFVDRAQALQFAERYSKEKGRRYGAAGYSEARWAEFTAAHKFTIVGVAYA
jgi:hypothetical protein